MACGVKKNEEKHVKDCVGQKENILGNSWNCFINNGIRNRAFILLIWWCSKPQEDSSSLHELLARALLKKNTMK